MQIVLTIDGETKEFATLEALQEHIDTLDSADVPEGQVVTPLPPHKVHSATGIVSPKPPVQVAREMKDRLSDLPKAFKDDDEY